jgi:gliding motility-associated-like protein
MKNIVLSAFFLVFAFSYNAQTINITDADNDENNPINCAQFNDGGIANFFDNGGNGNYGQDRRDTITICPNLPSGPKITAVFGLDVPFTFDIHSSDTLYVFDGPSVNSPLLGAHNSETNPNGFTHIASFENNPSGCLTFVFHSDDSNQGTGWGANITCGNPPQPFSTTIEAFINGVGPNALNPLDTGYVDVCFGDSVLLVTKPVFPFSLENNGFGYSQNDLNVNYEWEFSNGFVAPNNDSIWFTPPTRSGFYVNLKITDIFPQPIQTFCKIRVSQLPSFAGTGPIDDVLCINETTILLGGANATDTVGVQFPGGTFEIGGSFAGLLPLPDGSGVNYSTVITMNQFPDDAVFTSAEDLQSICVNMEHSYLGDLEMWLTCPNGTQVVLINSYSPGAIPGGFNGGGTFLGDANDQGNGTPGIGFDYCFSTVNATFGTMGQEFAAGNTIPVNSFAPPAGNSMNPNGIYLPETNFSALAGCPLNGNWTLFVRDNIGIDDGYIFEWGLYFNADLFPNSETYANTIASSWWTDSPSIISGVNDTAIVVLPPGPGNHPFTFNIIDNFGCHYDTTVNVFVKDPIVLNMPAVICQLSLTTTLNTGTNDGVWSSFNSVGTPTFSADNVNTTITFPTYGLYNLVYSDTSCTDKDTVTVLVEESPYFNFQSDFYVCPGATTPLSFNDSLLVSTFSWGTPGFDGLFTANLGAGTYTSSFTSTLGCTVDTTYTISTRPPNILANYPLVCGNTLNMNNNTGVNGGEWTSISTVVGNVTFENNNVNTLVTVPGNGEYFFIYTDACESDTTIVEFNTAPTLEIDDYASCFGVDVTLTPNEILSNANYSWNTGQNTPSIVVNQPGSYTVTASNACGTVSETSIVSSPPPNILGNYPLICSYTADLNLNTGNDGGTWTSIGGGIVNPQFGGNQINTTVTVPTLGSYLFVYTDNCESDTIQVNFNLPPTISIDGASTCVGELVTISAGEQLLNTSYLWSNGSTSNLIQVTESAVYEVTLTNSCGTASDTANVIFIPCLIEVPNVFTPSGDGSNEFFQLIESSGLINFNCTIVNRWGNVIREFTSSDFKWDGTDKSGNAVIEGVYFYKITANTLTGTEVIKHGNVTLIRKN